MNGFGAYSYLQRGASGSGVREMQNDLLQLGFSLPQYGADGKFGAETEQTVKDFQYTYGVTVDGIVGPQTASAIKEALGLLAQGQWDPSADPMQYTPSAPSRTATIPPPGVVYPTYPAQPAVQYQVGQPLAASFLGGLDWKWVGLGIAGIALLFYLTKQKGEGEEGY